MFEEVGRNQSIVIRDVMVGGPAWKSQQLFKGDTILSIDGRQLHGDEILKALQGNSIPGTLVKLEVRKAGSVRETSPFHFSTSFSSSSSSSFWYL